MGMSRRDFQEVADAVATAKGYLAPDDTAGHEALACVTRELARACAARYQGGYGFNWSRFREACGFPG